MKLMTYKIFGTVKQIKCDAKAKVSEVQISPTQDYAVRGTNDGKKKIALIRPKDDVGDAVLFEYKDFVFVTGDSISSLSPVLKCEQIVGFLFEKSRKRLRDVIRFDGVADKTGKGGEYHFCEIVLT